MPGGQLEVGAHLDSAGVTGQLPEMGSEPFQILALDGGGAKALFTAHVLARLEQDLGVSISESFDLIAGTSAGGIVALALGAGLTPAQIVSTTRSSSTLCSRPRGVGCGGVRAS